MSDRPAWIPSNANDERIRALKIEHAKAAEEIIRVTDLQTAADGHLASLETSYERRIDDHERLAAFARILGQFPVDAASPEVWLAHIDTLVTAWRCAPHYLGVTNRALATTREVIRQASISTQLRDILEARIIGLEQLGPRTAVDGAMDAPMLNHLLQARASVAALLDLGVSAEHLVASLQGDTPEAAEWRNRFEDTRHTLAHLRAPLRSADAMFAWLVGPWQRGLRDASAFVITELRRAGSAFEAEVVRDLFEGILVEDVEEAGIGPAPDAAILEQIPAAMTDLAHTLVAWSLSRASFEDTERTAEGLMQAAKQQVAAAFKQCQDLAMTVKTLRVLIDDLTVQIMGLQPPAPPDEAHDQLKIIPNANPMVVEGEATLHFHNSAEIAWNRICSSHACLEFFPVLQLSHWWSFHDCEFTIAICGPTYEGMRLVSRMQATLGRAKISWSCIAPASTVFTGAVTLRDLGDGRGFVRIHILMKPNFSGPNAIKVQRLKDILNATRHQIAELARP